MKKPREVSNWAKITQLLSDKARSLPQVCLTPKSMLFPHHHVYKSHKNINTIKFHLLNTLGMSHAGQMSK